MKKKKFERFKEILKETNGLNIDQLQLFYLEEEDKVVFVQFDFLGNNPIKITYELSRLADDYRRNNSDIFNVPYSINQLNKILRGYIKSHKKEWKPLNMSDTKNVTVTKIGVNHISFLEDDLDPFYYDSKLLPILTFLLRYE